MAIPVTCSCGEQYSVPEQHAGKTATCKQCGERIPIPRQRTQSAPPPADRTQTRSDDVPVIRAVEEEMPSKAASTKEKDDFIRATMSSARDAAKTASETMDSVGLWSIMWPSTRSAYDKDQRRNTRYPNARVTLGLARFILAIWTRFVTMCYLVACVAFPLVMLFGAATGKVVFIAVLLSPLYWIPITLLYCIPLLLAMFMAAAIEVSRSVLDGADDLCLIRSYMVENQP